MKKVICLYNGLSEGYNAKLMTYGNRLTIGKIYNVIRTIGNKKSPAGIEIEDNLGTPGTYVLEDTDGRKWFEDATSHIRDQKLKELGI